MEHFLHMRTLFLVVSVVGLVIFLCMFFIQFTRKTYPGFSYWTAASLIYFIGNLLLGFRDIFPDVITIILANTFIVVALLSIYYGLTLFSNSRQPLWPYALFTLFFIFLFILFTYHSPNINTRIVISSIVFFIFCVCALIHIYRYIPPFGKSSNLLLELSLFCAIAWSIFRAVYTLFYEKGIEEFLSSSSVQSLTIILFCGLFISLFFGLSILNFQRVEKDLYSSKREIKELEEIIPICAACKKIRDDRGFWNQVESYIQSHSSTKLSHAICPECMDKLYPDYADEE